MNKHNIRFIGPDTHKMSTEVTYTEVQSGATPVHHRASSTKVYLTEGGIPS